MDRDNWDDLRFVLAVADLGSVSAAARALGVNHATVLRRIAAFEARAGSALFDHTPRGYLVPPERRRIIEAAREVDRAAQGVWRLMRGAGAPVSGEVRVTSTDSLCLRVLPQIAAELRVLAPDLSLVFLCTNAHLDLGRVQADITVRPARQLPDDLAGTGVGQMRIAAFAPVGLDEADCDRLPWLGLHGALARSDAARWLEAEGIEPEGGADSFVVLAEMVALRQGRALLPEFLAAEDARLQPLPGTDVGMAVPLWVAAHPDLAEVPRVAKVRGLLCEALARRFAA